MIKVFKKKTLFSFFLLILKQIVANKKKQIRKKITQTKTISTMIAFIVFYHIISIFSFLQSLCRKASITKTNIFKNVFLSGCRNYLTYISMMNLTFFSSKWTKYTKRTILRIVHLPCYFDHLMNLAFFFSKLAELVNRNILRNILLSYYFDHLICLTFFSSKMSTIDEQEYIENSTA